MGLYTKEGSMNTIDFCFWLQGYFEISGDTEITKEQVQVIKDHLSLVFKHEIDPLREKQTTTPASVLNAAHSPVNDMQIRC
jgi:hypothetical protein